MTDEKKTEEKTQEKEGKAEEKQEVKVSPKLKKLIGEIEKLTVLELSDLVKALEEKFGVSAVTAVVPGASQAAITAGQPAGTEEATEEKTNFNVVLKNPGDKKIQAIKALREIKQGLGLTEAKKVVDMAVSEPQIILENAAKQQAEEAKKRLEETGATVELV